MSLLTRVSQWRRNRRPGESRDPVSESAASGRNWMPAFAGMVGRFALTDRAIALFAVGFAVFALLFAATSSNTPCALGASCTVDDDRIITGQLMLKSDTAFEVTLDHAATANRTVTIQDVAGTLYVSGGTDVALADGGTNKSITASNGAVVYSDADSLELSAVGSSGQVLRSGGAGAPSWSTATFPATAGTSGTLLQSNGTNWVNTTATYPGTAAGTGTILRADGTNWAASTATYPATVTANRLLYASATNVVSDLATGNNGVLVTDGSGVPSISSTLPAVKLGSLTSNGLVTTSSSDGTLSVTVPGTGVLTALGVNIGSAGAFVTFDGALGTPSSGTVTNLTGTASININGTVGATTPTTGAFTTGSFSGVLTSTNTTAATSSSTGAIVTSGGLGVAKSIYTDVNVVAGAPGSLVLVGTTAYVQTQDGTKIEQGIITLGSSSSAAQDRARFENANGRVGSIQTSGTSTSYNTTSDKRLKNVVGQATDVAVLRALIVNDYTWKSTGAAGRGVLAQDAYLVKPDAVRVGSDIVNAQGVLTDPWMIDYSKFVPDLIVGWQDHEARLKALETENAALRAAAVGKGP